MSKKKSYKDYKESYIDIVREYNIDTRLNYKKQVREFILIANSIQSDICNLSDSIKIGNYEKVQNKLGISKNAWKDVVSYSARKESMKQKTREKYIEHTREQIKSEMYKQMHLDKALDIRPEILVPKGNVDCSVDTINNPEYESILNDSVKTRSFINNVLYPKYKKLAEAAEYISEGDITYDRFKTMVDYEHYLGGYPSPNSPGKLEAVICKFLEAYYLMKKYQSPLFDSEFDRCLGLYHNMFELKETRIKPVPNNPLKC